MTKDLDYAIRVIKATIQDHSPEVCYPYFFIVGAGISAPEIPIASEIIKKCKRKCKELDEISYIQFENETKVHENNPMKYYSEWIEFAYPSLLYMIRRGETKTESSFWTTLEKKKSLSAFDYVNIILYCSSTGNKNTPHYAKAMEKMVNLTTEETKDLTKWWGDASIVGEYESKLVLALIHEKELP